MGYALGGGSGWVLLSWVPRDGRLINQYASDHSQSIASAVPILALDMYEHAYHIDFGANAKGYVDAFLRNIDWQAVEGRFEDATKALPPRPTGTAGIRRRARGRRRGSPRDACRRQAAAADRCASETFCLAAAGHRRRRRPGAIRSGSANG
jgi:hypothetical protein